MFDSIVMHTPCINPDCDLCGYDDLMRFSRRAYREPRDVYCLPGSGEGARILPWSLVDFMARPRRIQ